MQRVFGLLVVLVILCGTAFLLLQNNPEERTVTSADGRLTVVATLSPTDTLEVDTVPGSEAPLYTAVLGPIYQLYPGDKLLTIPATLIFSYDPALSNAESVALRVGYFDEAFQMWRPVETFLDTSEHRVSAKISSFSKWALLRLDDVARPNFDSEIAALLTAAPAGAVGYQLEVGYSDVPGDFVILNGAGKSGGCSGQYRTGTSIQMTSTSDIFGESLEYQIVALWQIGNGCGEKQVIE